MDGGPEPIEDQAERRQVRRQARSVHLGALALALGLTVLALLIPAGGG